MHIQALTQRSPEWHHWRAQGIGASDSAILLKRSPYKTPWQLWAERTGLILPEDLRHNPHVQRGIAHEPRARALFETRLGEILLPVCVESAHNPLFRASLDGMTAAGEPVELKCPSPGVYEELLKMGTGSPHYALHWIQVQHQLLVCNAPQGWLVFYSEAHPAKPLNAFTLQADPGFQQELQQAGLAFWHAIQTGIAPEADPERDLYLPQGQAQAIWHTLTTQYQHLHQAITRLEDQLQPQKHKLHALQDQMVQHMGAFRQAQYAGLRITRFLSRGRIDYPQLLQDKLGPLADHLLDTYRRQPAQEQVRITLTAPDPQTPAPSSHTTVSPQVSCYF